MAKFLSVRMVQSKGGSNHTLLHATTTYLKSHAKLNSFFQQKTKKCSQNPKVP